MCVVLGYVQDQSLMRSVLFIRMSATVFVQPLDLVKNRMQLSGKSAGICDGVQMDSGQKLGVARKP